MNTQRIVKILEYLSNAQHPVTSNEIANNLNVCSKTIRNEIKNIEILFDKSICEVTVKTNFGIKLVIYDRESFFGQLEKLKMQFNNIPTNNKDRANYLLFRLLTTHISINPHRLEEELFVTSSVIHQCINIANDMVSVFDLKIINRGGLIFVGNEINKRMCISYHMSRYLGNSMYYKLDILGILGQYRISKIYKKLKKIFFNSKYKLSDIAVDSMINHILISIVRMANSFCIEDIELTIGNNLEYDLSNTIYQMIDQEGIPNNTENELKYIQLLLLGKRTIHPHSIEENFNFIDEHIWNLVSRMLDKVYESSKVDLRDNLDLRINLSLHLIPFEMRMKYSMTYKNDMIKQIKQNYSFAYNIATIGCQVLSEYYCKSINDDEIGFIALIINLGILNSRKQTKKKRILVICSSGQASSKLLSYLIMQKFKEEISKLDVVSIKEFYKKNIDEYDCIFTTVQFEDLQDLHIPVLHIEQILKDEDYTNINNFFKKTYNSDNVTQYLDENLFFTDIDISNKKELLIDMVNKIKQTKELPDEFYDYLLKREEFGKSSFGNGVAIPHPYLPITKDSFVAIFLLKKNIDWGEGDRVKIVFLLSPSIYAENSMEKFYTVMSSIILDHELVENIIKRKSFNYIVELFNTYRG